MPATPGSAPGLSLTLQFVIIFRGIYQIADIAEILADILSDIADKHLQEGADVYKSVSIHTKVPSLLT